MIRYEKSPVSAVNSVTTCRQPCSFTWYEPSQLEVNENQSKAQQHNRVLILLVQATQIASTRILRPPSIKIKSIHGFAKGDVD